jgi:hypothetical protein
MGTNSRLLFIGMCIFLIISAFSVFSVKSAPLKIIDLGYGSGPVITRTVVIPEISAGQVTKLFIFDLKNGGTISVDGKEAGSLNYCMYPGIIDISRFVNPGKPCTITVTCNPRPSGMPVGYTGSKQGVVRGMELRIYSRINVSDCFIRTSVANDNFYVDVWLQNNSSVDQKLNVKLGLTAWNQGASWSYAAIPDQPVTIAANKTIKKTFGPFKWALGEKSYWWPNIPYSESYEAQLHILNMQLTEGSKTLDIHVQRFGFTEITEQKSGNALYFAVNGVPVFQNFDSPTEVNMRPGAAFHFSSAWSSSDGGAKESIRRYQSIGINGFRIHQAPVSDAILNAADETGFFIVPEAGINQNKDLAIDTALWGANIRAMIRFTRQHPCVVRYSLWNETKTNNRKVLINFCSNEDATRPYSFSEDIQFSARGGKVVSDDGRVHAWSLAHYWDQPSDSTVIVGCEENNWFEKINGNGMAGAARNSILYRYWGYAVFAPWTWLNYWPDFIPGLTHSTRYQHSLRGLDFGRSDLAQYAINCLNIYACADINLVMAHQKILPGIFQFENPAYDEEILFDDGPLYYGGTTASHEVVQFNNSLTTITGKVIMEARWDSPTGTVIYTSVSDNVSIEPASHAKHVLNFPWPDPGSSVRTLYLSYHAYVNEHEVFNENRYRVRITNAIPPSPFTRLEASNCEDIWNCKTDSAGITGFKSIRSGWQANSVPLMEERGQTDLATWPKCDIYRGWIKYTLDFGRDAKMVKVNLTRKGGSSPVGLELRVDNPNGRLVSVIPVPVSTSAQVCSGEITNLIGVHDIYLIIPYLFDNEIDRVEWVTFTR